jgi:hypothetical protein
LVEVEEAVVEAVVEVVEAEVEVEAVVEAEVEVAEVEEAVVEEVVVEAVVVEAVEVVAEVEGKFQSANMVVVRSWDIRHHIHNLRMVVVLLHRKQLVRHRHQ